MCMCVNVREREIPQAGGLAQHHYHNLLLLAVVLHDQQAFVFDWSLKDPEGHWVYEWDSIICPNQGEIAYRQAASMKIVQRA